MAPLPQDDWDNLIKMMLSKVGTIAVITFIVLLGCLVPAVLYWPSK